MAEYEIIAIVVGGIALVLLIILSIWYLRRKKHHDKGRKRNSKEATSQKQTEEPIYSTNERLDGARVSHRRNHPDRISEENQWKQKREREKEITENQKKADNDRKNKLLLIYSPCNAEVLAYHESIDEAENDGYDNPGVLLAPNDDKLYAPINGRVCWNKLDDSMVKIVSEDGTEVMLQCKHKEETSKRDLLTMKVSDQVMITTGEMICRFQNGIVKSNNKTVQIRMEISNFIDGQLLMIKRVNYLSHGDKAMTLRLK
jgi:phosphotransferase system IIA component